MDDNQLDRAIDRVAREVTAREPHDAGEFRASVLARLDERAPRMTWRSPWVLSPIAVAAIVLIAVFALRDQRHVMPTQSEAVATQRDVPSHPAKAERSMQDAASPLAPETSSSMEREAPSRSAKASRSIEDGASASMEREASAERLSEVAALAPAPLAVASIVVPEIVPAASIELPPLETIEPITVAPIGEPQGERR